MNDNLFDKDFTWLDLVKILLLIVTAFSTWNVVDILTPNGRLAWLRELCALGVVEGAFLGFEAATAKAKNKRQKAFATIGFFCSIAVIGIFAAISGLLEFGGEVLLTQNFGEFMGMQWLAGDVVAAIALVIFMAWIVGLASLYRLYSLNDPDQKAKLEMQEQDGKIIEAANEARGLALQRVRNVIATKRALAAVKDLYKGELNADELDSLAEDVDHALQTKYHSAAPIEVEPTNPLVVKSAETELPNPGGSFPKQ